MVINAILVSSNFIVDGGKLPEKVQTNINVFQQTLKHFKRDQIAVFIVKSTLSTPIPQCVGTLPPGFIFHCKQPIQQFFHIAFCTVRVIPFSKFGFLVMSLSYFTMTIQYVCMGDRNNQNNMDFFQIFSLFRYIYIYRYFLIFLSVD